MSTCNTSLLDLYICSLNYMQCYFTNIGYFSTLSVLYNNVIVTESSLHLQHQCLCHHQKYISSHVHHKINQSNSNAYCAAILANISA